MLKAVVCMTVALLAYPSAALAQDTVRVRSTGTGAWGAEVKLTRLTSIGQVDGPPEYALGRVTALAADVRGRFYTYDAADKQIRAYDASGKFLHKVGRDGAGPGEYRWVFGMSIVRDSQLAVFDISGARITIFEPSGKLVRTITQPRMTSGFDHGSAANAAGILIFRVPPKINGRADVEMPVEGAPKGATVSDGYAIRLRDDGQIIDSIPIPPPPGAERGFFISTPDGGSFNFIPQAHAAVSPLGATVFGHGSAYRFTIRTLKDVRVVEHPWTPVPVVGGERDNWKQWVTHFEGLDKGRFTYSVPPTKPAFRDLFTDSDGRIWVSLYRPAEKRDYPPRPAGDARPRLFWRQNATHDVFSPSGAYLGRVELERDSQLLAAVGDRIWVLSRGADDEDRIIVYRLTGAQGRPIK